MIAYHFPRGFITPLSHLMFMNVLIILKQISVHFTLKQFFCRDRSNLLSLYQTVWLRGCEQLAWRNRRTVSVLSWWSRSTVSYLALMAVVSEPSAICSRRIESGLPDCSATISGDGVVTTKSVPESSLLTAGRTRRPSRSKDDPTERHQAAGWNSLSRSLSAKYWRSKFKNILRLP